jgi:hypothetical protein
MIIPNCGSGDSRQRRSMSRYLSWGDEMDLSSEGGQLLGFKEMKESGNAWKTELADKNGSV